MEGCPLVSYRNERQFLVDDGRSNIRVEDRNRCLVNPRHIFVQGDVGDRALVERLLAEHQPRAVVNFAAESHVDRSIHGPGDFIHTNSHSKAPAHSSASQNKGWVMACKSLEAMNNMCQA